MIVRVASISIGYGFLALGVLGLFLPVLQGVLFLVLGLLILSRHASWAERLLGWLKQRHPRLHRVIEQAESLLLRGERAVLARVKRLFGRAPRA
jgi:uncharacterized membrane protein YbaN (DUF454 family)